MIYHFRWNVPYMLSERGVDDTIQGGKRRCGVNYDLQGNPRRKRHIIDSRFRLDVQSDAAVTFTKRNHKKLFFLSGIFRTPCATRSNWKKSEAFPWRNARAKAICFGNALSHWWCGEKKGDPHDALFRGSGINQKLRLGIGSFWKQVTNSCCSMFQLPITKQRIWLPKILKRQNSWNYNWNNGTRNFITQDCLTGILKGKRDGMTIISEFRVAG